MTIARLCEGCGQPFQPSRPNERHHPGGACKQRAYRRRKAEAAAPSELEQLAARFEQAVWEARSLRLLSAEESLLATAFATEQQKRDYLDALQPRRAAA